MGLYSRSQLWVLLAITALGGAGLAVGAWRRAHPEDERHGRQAVCFRAFNELLHEWGAVSLACGSPTVRFVDDQDEVLRRMSHGVRRCLPESKMPVAFLGQDFVFSQQLCIDEVNVARIKPLCMG